MKFEPAELEAAGFKSFPPSEVFNPHAIGFWQKRILLEHNTIAWDRGTTLFFINLYQYPPLGQGDFSIPEKWTAEATFYGLGEAYFSFDVKISHANAPNDRLESVETFFRSVFNGMCCQPDRNV